jgi:hypothetical protein
MKITSTQQESLEALSLKGTCIEFFSAYQDMDLERMLQLCTPDSMIEFIPLGEAYKGRTYEIGKAVWAALMDSFPDLDNTVAYQQYEETARTVTCKVSIFGTQAKDFAGLPSRGFRFESDHIFIFRFNEESRIDYMTVNWNHENFVKQLTGN